MLHFTMHDIRPFNSRFTIYRPSNGSSARVDSLKQGAARQTDRQTERRQTGIISCKPALKSALNRDMDVLVTATAGMVLRVLPLSEEYTRACYQTGRQPR